MQSTTGPEATAIHQDAIVEFGNLRILRDPSTTFSSAEHFESSFKSFAAAIDREPIEVVAKRFRELHGILGHVFSDSNRDIKDPAESLALAEIRKDFSVVTTKDFAAAITDPKQVELLAEMKGVTDRLSQDFDSLLHRIVRSQPEVVREMMIKTLPPSIGLVPSLLNPWSAAIIMTLKDDLLAEGFESYFKTKDGSPELRAKFTGQFLHKEGLI